MEANEQVTFPPFPVTATHLPVTRCQICHRTVAYRPDNLTEVLTEHYRRPIPKYSASNPGSRARRPPVLPRSHRHQCRPAPGRLYPWDEPGDRKR
jgi:hypothetical protein